MDTNLNKKVLDLIYSSIISEGGDGDAIWLSKHTSLSDLKVLIDEYNTSNNTGWKVEENDNYINWGIDQEWATITCDENFFNLQPSWIILRINYLHYAKWCITVTDKLSFYYEKENILRRQLVSSLSDIKKFLLPLSGTYKGDYAVVRMQNGDRFYINKAEHSKIAEALNCT